jgi:hypothetical protein
MTNELEQLKKLLIEHPDWGRTKISRALHCSEKHVRTLLAKLPERPAKPSQHEQPKEEFTREESDNQATLYSASHTIRTLEDLLAYAKVDLDVWEVERYTVNRWEVVMREPATTVGGAGEDATISTGPHGEKSTLWTRESNKPLHEPLYQIKAWLRRRRVVERTREIVQQLLAAFKEQAPKRPAIHHKRMDGCLFEVSIFDLHLGKLCWAPEAGEHYDSKIARSGFKEALEALIERAKGFPVERVLFPVGNDFFNVDNAANETAGGTPQREDGRWQKSFVLGRKLMVDAILRLSQIAPVDVLMVSGNHDTERVFYLGDSLSGWFSRTPDVMVDNGPARRKYYQWHRNLLGFTHGKEEKHLNLPLIMATEVPDKWAATDFREFHVGHWHHKKDIHFQPVNEFNGIRVRLIPSLCPADDWHRMKGFEGLRAAEAYLWHKTEGCVGTFSFTP